MSVGSSFYRECFRHSNFEMELKMTLAMSCFLAMYGLDFFLNSLTLKSQLCIKLWLSICTAQEDIGGAQLNIGRAWVLPRP